MLLASFIFIICTSGFAQSAAVPNPQTLLQNGLNAQILNTEFLPLRVTDTCTSGQVGCILGNLAQCVQSQWQVTQCSTDQECFALPSVTGNGTTVACTSLTSALSVMSASGVQGGLVLQSVTTAVPFPVSDSASNDTSIAVETYNSTSVSFGTAVSTTSSTADVTSALATPTSIGNPVAPSIFTITVTVTSTGTSTEASTSNSDSNTAYYGSNVIASASAAASQSATFTASADAATSTGIDDTQSASSDDPSSNNPPPASYNAPSSPLSPGETVTVLSLTRTISLPGFASPVPTSDSNSVASMSDSSSASAFPPAPTDVSNDAVNGNGATVISLVPSSTLFSTAIQASVAPTLTL